MRIFAIICIFVLSSTLAFGYNPDDKNLVNTNENPHVNSSVKPQQQINNYKDISKTFHDHYECSPDATKQSAKVNIGVNMPGYIVMGISDVKNSNITQIEGVTALHLALEFAKSDEMFMAGNLDYFAESAEFWEKSFKEFNPQSSDQNNRNTIKTVGAPKLEALEKRPGELIHPHPNLESLPKLPGQRVSERAGDKVPPTAGSQIAPYHSDGLDDRPGAKSTGAPSYDDLAKKPGESYKRTPSYSELEKRAGDISNPNMGKFIGLDGVYTFKITLSPNGNIKTLAYREGHRTPVFINIDSQNTTSADPVFLKLQSSIEKLKRYSYCCTKGDSADYCDTKYVPLAGKSSSTDSKPPVLNEAERKIQQRDFDQKTISPFTGNQWGAKDPKTPNSNSNGAK